MFFFYTTETVFRGVYAKTKAVVWSCAPWNCYSCVNSTSKCVMLHSDMVARMKKSMKKWLKKWFLANVRCKRKAKRESLDLQTCIQHQRKLLKDFQESEHFYSNTRVQLLKNEWRQTMKSKNTCFMIWKHSRMLPTLIFSVTGHFDKCSVPQ